MIGGRGAFGLVSRRCLAVALPWTALAVVTAVVLHRTAPPQLTDDEPLAAASPWFVLPLFAAALGTSLAAVRGWPLFAARQPGADTLRRLQRGRLAGNGAAIAAALLVQFGLSLCALVALGAALGAPPAHAHVEPTPAADAVLLPGSPPLRFAAAAPTTCSTLLLRPRAGLPQGPIAATGIEVLADGERLSTALLECVEDRQLLRLEFAPRAIHELQLVATSGTVPLWFPRGAVVLVGTASRPWPWNAALVAVIALVPTFVALVLALACGLAAALPTVTTVVAAVVFVEIVGEIGPLADAVRALLRGQWLPASPVFPACLPSLAVGCVAMILAMSWPAGSRR